MEGKERMEEKNFLRVYYMTTEGMMNLLKRRGEVLFVFSFGRFYEVGNKCKDFFIGVSFDWQVNEKD